MKNLLALAFALSLAACGTKTDAGASPDQPSETAVEAVSIESSVHNVKCGCGIDSIGECGNYVEFDGEYAALMNSEELGLGPMEWCHKDGVTAEVAGTRNGDEFTATALKVTE